MHPDSKWIDEMGGTEVVADLCEVSSSAVSQWRQNGIPKARLMYLRMRRKNIDWAARDRDAKRFESRGVRR